MAFLIPLPQDHMSYLAQAAGVTAIPGFSDEVLFRVTPEIAPVMNRAMVYNGYLQVAGDDLIMKREIYAIFKTFTEARFVVDLDLLDVVEQSTYKSYMVLSEGAAVEYQIREPGIIDFCLWSGSEEVRQHITKRTELANTPAGVGVRSSIPRAVFQQVFEDIGKGRLLEGKQRLAQALPSEMADAFVEVNANPTSMNSIALWYDGQAREGGEDIFCVQGQAGIYLMRDRHKSNDLIEITPVSPEEARQAIDRFLEPALSIVPRE